MGAPNISILRVLCPKRSTHDDDMQAARNFATLLDPSGCQVLVCIGCQFAFGASVRGPKNFVHQGIDRLIVGCMRARYVNPTPADLGGVTSVLYELEHRYKYSFLGCCVGVWRFG